MVPDDMDDRPMTGSTVLITGATGGIGKATALGLAGLGARVAIIGHHQGRTEAEDPARSQRLLVPLLRAFMTSPAEGAATSIRLASDRAFRARTGLYVTRRGPKRSSRRSYDRTSAARLWQISADLVGLPRAD